MYISSLKLRNFRNFQKANFKFNEGVNTIIGANGTGKTNALYAIRLLIDENLPRSSVNLSETDFNRGLTRWQGHWIIISLHFGGLSDDDSSQALIYQGTHSDSEKGSLTLFFRPKYEVRKRLFELSDPSNPQRMQAIQTFLETIKINLYEAVLYGRGNGNICDDFIYTSIVGDFVGGMFPDPDLDDSSVLGTLANQYVFKNDFACTYAKALRDVIGDLKNTRKSPLLRLLQNLNINESTSETVSNTIKDLNSHITNLQEIRELATGVTQSLHKTVGHTYAPRIEINSNLSDDFNQTLRALTIRASEVSGEAYLGDLYELSLGGANLLYLALKLEEYNRLDHARNKAAHFLLIEEPEAHLHNHIQKTLFQKYHNHENTQIILTTHSSHISSSCALNAVNILYIDNISSEVAQPSTGMSPGEITKIERYLDATRSTLLFARSVILVEGDAEMIIIPELVKKVLGITLDEIGVSLINVGSTQFTNIANLFSTDRIKRRCAIITDNDLSIVPVETGAYDDVEYQKKCIDSQTSGEARKVKLDSYCNDNEFVTAFYAENTFEVEFIKHGNKSYVIDVICNEIYSRKHDQISSIEKINSLELSVFGKEILRLAEKEGKGWLALAISSRLDKHAFIPDYILDALCFVSGLRSNHLISMIKHNLESEYENFIHTVNHAFNGDPTDNDIIESFCSLHPETVITTLIKKRGENSD
ncbi:ATP-dependent nuclease [Paenibacillus beijingensis]|uniref:Uncharacterized protein n=1 Tax=Paenibacillus beijingensis TaxID=1126833 RepID=A0A0D5NFM3_9BACL|nr:AAA family ATPase [Paenibacillus beijingensis]AJY73772.1 hypothetical protein VN24_02905 [Paenibacillus beijingensis]